MSFAPNEKHISARIARITEWWIGKWIHPSILWKRIRLMIVVSVLVLLIWKRLCTNEVGRTEWTKLNKLFNICEKPFFYFFIILTKGYSERERKKIWKELYGRTYFVRIEKHLPYVRFTNKLNELTATANRFLFAKTWFLFGVSIILCVCTLHTPLFQNVEKNRSVLHPNTSYAHTKKGAND